MNVHSYVNIEAFLETDKVPRKIIATPIRAIYDEIKSRSDSEERKRGWWDNFTYKTKDRQKIMVINSHQGNTIVDPVLIANENCDFLFFIGFCGGFHPDMNISNIAIASQSYFEWENKLYKSRSDLSILKKMFPNAIHGTNITVESVIRETQAVRTRELEYLKEGTVSADQETTYIYKESRIPSVSVMVITDLPLKKKGLLFKFDSSDSMQIENGVKNLIDNVLESIDIF